MPTTKQMQIFCHNNSIYKFWLSDVRIFVHILLSPSTLSKWRARPPLCLMVPDFFWMSGMKKWSKETAILLMNLTRASEIRLLLTTEWTRWQKATESQQNPEHTETDAAYVAWCHIWWIPKLRTHALSKSLTCVQKVGQNFYHAMLRLSLIHIWRCRRRG